jgi:hypothetical protein
VLSTPPAFVLSQDQTLRRVFDPGGLIRPDLLLRTNPRHSNPGTERCPASHDGSALAFGTLFSSQGASSSRPDRHLPDLLSDSKKAADPLSRPAAPTHPVFSIGLRQALSFPSSIGRRMAPITGNPSLPGHPGSSPMVRPAETGRQTAQAMARSAGRSPNRRLRRRSERTFAAPLAGSAPGALGRAAPRGRR